MSTTPTPATSAFSLDGRTFTYEAPIARGLRLGALVRLTTPDGRGLLGQLHSQRAATGPEGRMATGEGMVLAPIDPPGTSSEAVGPFEEATVDMADEADLDAAPSVADDDAVLTVGTLQQRSTVPARLRAAGFNRHTFLCGQSGSGKTYALGVLLEQLVAETTLPLLVLDPNGDHVHLGRARSDAAPHLAASYEAAAEGIAVVSAASTDDDALRITFADLGADGQAALLRLDPLRDRTEYNALLHLITDADGAGWQSEADVREAIGSWEPDVGRDVRMRLENLGVFRLGMWARQEARSVVERWQQDRPRGLIADVSGFSRREERLSVTYALLHHLWRRREDRSPVLIVVDEAHDVCPSVPSDELQALLLDLFVRIAGEGRKYGLHLLLATQRPDKLHANVVSQCDNLVLMRTNSAGDRAAIAELFSYAPPGLVDAVGRFGLGEVLLAGRITPFPTLAKVGRRLTPEGGGDVPTDWARRRVAEIS